MKKNLQFKPSLLCIDKISYTCYLIQESEQTRNYVNYANTDNAFSCNRLPFSFDLKLKDTIWIRIIGSLLRTENF